jgi:hypothetical protein
MAEKRKAMLSASIMCADILNMKQALSGRKGSVWLYTCENRAWQNEGFAMLFIFIRGETEWIR